MRKKRLFAFSLMIGLTASFITLQINPAITAPAQDAKVKQNGLISGCSDSVIDALDECIQERFSKSDMRFGALRITPTTLHMNYFQTETQSEREAISELEKGGWQVAFYLAGRRILGTKPDLTKPMLRIDGQDHPIINGPIAITSPVIFNRIRMIEQFDLPEPQKLWDDAQKAMLEFEKKDQYGFSFGKWSVAARPIRAKEACLKCHTGPVTTAPSTTPPKVGDALGVAMYAYARKQ